jgi:outer membrane protein assembly factor BamB
VCAVAYQGKIGCFDGVSGNVSWSRDLSSTAGLSVDARYVFVSDDRGAVQALDRAGGATIWKQDRLFLRRLTAPLPLGDVVAVGDVEGYIHFLSRESGAFVGRAATDGSPIRSSLLRLEQGLLVQTQAGNLYALSLR